jgi:hypothetical protein
MTSTSQKSLPASVASGCGVTTMPLFIMISSDIDGRASGDAFKHAPPPGFDVVSAGR